MSNAIYVPGADEYKGTGTGDFGVMSEDEYKVRVDSYRRVNRVSQYNPEGKETIDFVLTPVSFADDEDANLVDENGNDLHPEKHVLFFYDPNKLGVRPQISKSRKFLAAALGIAADGPIALPGGYDELVGKEFIAHIGVRNGRNYVIDTRPIRKRARVRTADESPKRVNNDLVDKAKAMFDAEEMPF